MKTLFKKAAFRIAPRPATEFFSARARAHSQKVIAGWGNSEVIAKLVGRFGNTVQAGPFKGLVMPPITHAEQAGPYLLGTYESELSNAWPLILAKTFAQIIDIGSKFGFYAVGMSRRYPAAKVIAFDTDRWARKATALTAAANQCRNVQVKSFCSADWLAQHVARDSLIISDCEGYEVELFRPSVIAKLGGSTVLIETHECFVPGITSKLAKAFSATHAVTEFNTTMPRLEAPPLSEFSHHEQQLAAVEVRAETRWLLCQPHTRT